MGVELIVTELTGYQHEGVLAIRQFRGKALLADEQGLGKTVQSLFWIRKIPKHRPVIIVAPASMKYTWQSEALLHFNMRTEVLEGRKPRRGLPGDIVVLNYEILHAWLPVLLKAKPQCVVFDEISYCKNTTAQRTKAAIKLSKGVPSRLGLSGTPMVNRPIELWPVLKIIRPDIFPSKEEYAWRYCKPRYTPWGWQYTGATRTKELNQILRQEVMIRRLKRDVMPELPDKERRMISYRLPDKKQKEYDYAQREFLKWLRGVSPSRAVKAKKSPALTKVGYMLRLVAQMKIAWTAQWIEEFFENHPGEKLVALTMHRFVIDHLKDRFPKALIIDGRVTGRLRHETVRSFQNNPRSNLLLGNWRAAGMGITLTAACHFVGLDFPWTPGDLFQGEDRIHRYGQKRKVIIFYLAVLNTIEEKLIKILRSKAKILDAVLNGEASEEDLDIFEALLTEMKRELKR